MLTVTLLVACGPPSHQYVRNTEQRTAFKLPRAWTLFDESELLGDTGGEPSAGSPDPREWLVGFDADPAPAVGHVIGADGTMATDYPMGIAGVFRLSTQQRDQINLGALRNVVIPIDSISEEVGQHAVRLLEYDDHVVRDGYRGVRVEFQVLESAAAEAAGVPVEGTALLDDTYVHVSQTAYFDESTERVYVFAVMCSTECYGRNRGDIDTAVESWTVLP
jgi:hypothetical protein